VLLLGAMGSGKTTVGVPLAARLARPFRDSDVELHDHGLDAKALLEEAGRAALHRIEADLVDAALSAKRPSVIAAAASVVDDEATCARIREAATVVYLRASTATLVERIGAGTSRPIGTDVGAEITALNDPRRARYEALADIIVDVDSASAEALVDQIAKALTREVVVSLGPRSYPVLIGPGVKMHLAEVLPPSASGR